MRTHNSTLMPVDDPESGFPIVLRTGWDIAPLRARWDSVPDVNNFDAVGDDHVDPISSRSSDEELGVARKNPTNPSEWARLG